MENSILDNRVIITPEQFDKMLNMVTDLKEKYFERLTFYANKTTQINIKNSHLDEYEKLAVAKRMIYMEDILKRKVCQLSQSIWEIDKLISRDIPKE